MAAILKGALLALVLATLTTLIGSMAFSVLLYPGYWIARLFLPLPDPYPLSSTANPPYILAVHVVNILFWGLLFLAWITAATAHGRARQGRPLLP